MSMDLYSRHSHINRLFCLWFRCWSWNFNKLPVSSYRVRYMSFRNGIFNHHDLHAWLLQLQWRNTTRVSHGYVSYRNRKSYSTCSCRCSDKRSLHRISACAGRKLRAISHPNSTSSIHCSLDWRTIHLLNLHWCVLLTSIFVILGPITFGKVGLEYLSYGFGFIFLSTEIMNLIGPLVTGNV